MVSFTLRSLCPWSTNTQYTSSGRDNRCDMGDVCEPTGDLTPVVNTAVTLLVELRKRVQRIVPVHAQDWSIPGKDAEILLFGIHRDLFQSLVFPRQQSVAMWVAVSPPALQFAFNELHLSPNSSQPGVPDWKASRNQTFLGKEIMINIFVSCSPPMTRIAWRTYANRQTGSRLFLPAASRCTLFAITLVHS
jgi:hypothetical protein